MAKEKHIGTWAWISMLYFVEGLPNALVASFAVLFYKDMGLSNEETAKITSVLYLPWVFKALWSPLVECLSTRRAWVFWCSAVFSGCFILMSLAAVSSLWVFLTCALFMLIGICSATYDIAADGFYMTALDAREQAFFVGIRNSFYRLAVLFAQGALLVFAGFAIKYFDSTPLGWSAAFALCGAVSVFAFAWLKIFLPKAAQDKSANPKDARELFADFFSAFASFFRRPMILGTLFFILFYRFSEAQLSKMVQPFLKDPRELGGLGLAVEDIGLVYGITAPVTLLLGGIIGGVLISRTSLRRCIWPMALAINIPNLVYLYMAYAMPQSLLEIGALIAVEQFGYGLGFAGYMMYLIHVADGRHKTSHYAICTAFMAMGLVLPGYVSGQIQASLGYLGFFQWVMLATLVSFVATWFAYRTLPEKGDKNLKAS